MRVLAIDPGPERSAVVDWDSKTRSVGDSEILANVRLREALPNADCVNVIAIEMVACYGMPVGKEVFETCLWIGRLMERAASPVRLVYRQEVKLHHCGSPRAKDSNIRQALIDKYGAPGTKKAPGLLYGIKSHLWAALAIATFVTETSSTPVITRA